MLFQESRVHGAFLIELERITDDRGFFARAWCSEQFGKRGLSQKIVQVNTALSHRAGTLRGMHFQRAPHAEVKVVQVPRGAAYDVVLDLRPESPSYCQWEGFELTGENFRALYIPEGCAHGYLTLDDETVLTYSTSVSFQSSAATGVRYDDPAFGIQWPRAASVISKADQNWPDYVREVTQR
jgi:dTDP-4-dehydrorhamnose 3,5-epimerase